MYYRRKILLSLLEACGGELSKTDMEKLLFLCCAERGVNYYDFFPHRFGCFSVLSYLDKRVLAQQGYLANTETFMLRRGKSFMSELLDDDRDFLCRFAVRTKNLRSDELVRHTYLNYPHYARRSEILDRVLNADERKPIEELQADTGEQCLFTIGYEGLTIDAYIDKLITHSVRIVVDVRRNPLSRKYGFSKTQLKNYLDSARISYEHIPELGIASSKRRALKTPKDYERLFDQYASLALPECGPELDQILRLLRTYRRVALTCFEANPVSCHRHKITEQLNKTKHLDKPIVHIQ